MKNGFEYHVSLRVVHPTMDPELICKSLNREARYRWKAGAPRQTPKGTPLEGRYKTTYCTFDIGSGSDGELAHCLELAVESLSQYADFLKQLRSSGGEVMFYVFWHPNGDTGEVFDVSLLSKMAELGIDFGLNVFDDRNVSADPGAVSDIQ